MRGAYLSVDEALDRALKRKWSRCLWPMFQTMLAWGARAIPLLFCGALLNAELKTSPLFFTGTRSPCGCAGEAGEAPLALRIGGKVGEVPRAAGSRHGRTVRGLFRTLRTVYPHAGIGESPGRAEYRYRS